MKREEGLFAAFAELIRRAVAEAEAVPAAATDPLDKTSEELADWTLHTVQGIDFTGVTVAVFSNGKMLANSPAVVARIALAEAGNSDALKASFAECPCDNCQAMAGFPAYAVLAGFKAWIGPFLATGKAMKACELREMVLAEVEP